MATFSSILVPAVLPATNQSVTNGSAGTAVTLGVRVKFAINANQDINVVFYNSASAAVTPSATVGFRIPANSTMTFDLSNFSDTINFYNLGSSSTTVSIQQLTVN